MELPEYITQDEVKRVCRELGLRDWTGLTDAQVDAGEARILLEQVNKEGMEIDPEAFRIGLEVELEHGTRFPDANVTNNHPVLTGLIVLAHLKESLDYYHLLEVAELEGDLLKALAREDGAKAKGYYTRLARARIALREVELNRLEG
ncbi:MAG: hypothetical protein K9M82_08820 [Deltaproteobacteria bacterium]|nr:hypothetical protein [Deltaproteobacteria bacterium]